MPKVEKSHQTPSIPLSFSKLTAPGFRNIAEAFPNQTLIYGTETLCGDWQGKILLLAQDFAEFDYVKVHGYHHYPKFKTNKQLVTRLQENQVSVKLDGTGSMSCGMLYGSACYLLKEGSIRSGLKSGWQAASREVLNFTISNMPNVQAIACLGQVSFNFVMALAGKKTSFQESRDSGDPVISSVATKDLLVFGLPHPSRGRTDVAIRLWRGMFDKLANAA